MNRDTLSRTDLLSALRVKATDRGSLSFIEDHARHLENISASPEIAKIWSSYTRNYPYAKGIAMPDILSLIAWVFEENCDFHG